MKHGIIHRDVGPAEIKKNNWKWSVNGGYPKKGLYSLYKNSFGMYIAWYAEEVHFREYYPDEVEEILKPFGLKIIGDKNYSTNIIKDFRSLYQ